MVSQTTRQNLKLHRSNRQDKIIRGFVCGGFQKFKVFNDFRLQIARNVSF